MTTTTTTNSNGKVVVPTDFICPITMEIMEHPVMTRYGQCFDRSAILKWMSSSEGVECECPLTRKPLRLSDIINNYALAIRIKSWCELNDYPCNQKEIPSTPGEDVVQAYDNDDMSSLVCVLPNAKKAKTRKIRNDTSIGAGQRRQELSRAQSSSALTPTSAPGQKNIRNFIGRALSWTQRS